MKFDDKDMQEWFDSRPPFIQEKIKAYPPEMKYRIKDTGQIVTIHSYGEKDGTSPSCTVIILQKDNPTLLFDRKVFGISYEDLEAISN